MALKAFSASRHYPDIGLRFVRLKKIHPFPQSTLLLAPLKVFLIAMFDEFDFITSSRLSVHQLSLHISSTKGASQLPASPPPPLFLGRTFKQNEIDPSAHPAQVLGWCRLEFFPSTFTRRFGLTLDANLLAYVEVVLGVWEGACIPEETISFFYQMQRAAKNSGSVKWWYYFHLVLLPRDVVVHWLRPRSEVHQKSEVGLCMQGCLIF